MKVMASNIKTWQVVMIIGGFLIVAVAILDLMDVPLTFPTSNNTANIAIGAGVVAIPFIV